MSLERAVRAVDGLNVPCVMEAGGLTVLVVTEMDILLEMMAEKKHALVVKEKGKKL